MKQKQSTVIEAAFQSEPVDPAGLVPLSSLAAGGFGWGEFTRTPKDAVDALARQLAGLVVLDTLGRRCIPTATARRLLEERAAAEERQRETRRRRAEEWARRPRPVRGGVPAVEGLSPVESLTAAGGVAEDEARKDAAAAKVAAMMRGENVGGRYTSGEGR